MRNPKSADLVKTRYRQRNDVALKSPDFLREKEKVLWLFLNRENPVQGRGKNERTWR